jgi:hypothetical protein
MKSQKPYLLAAACMLLTLSLPVWAQIPALPYEQPTSGTITSTAQTNTYTLPVNLNDVLNFTVVATSSASASTFGPCISLYAPGGSVPVDEAGGGYSADVEMNGYKATVTGDYTVLIQDCADVATGDYVIFVEKTNNPKPVAALSYAAVTTGQITSVTQSNAYSFSANKNDIVSFTLVATKSTSASTFGPCILLYDTTGTPVLDQAGGGYASDVEMNGYQIPTTGTYNVFIKDCADIAMGDYVVFVQKTNDPIDSSPIVYDQVQTGTIGSTALSNAYTLIGTMGDVLNFTVVATSSTGASTFGPCILLYNTSGTQPLDSAGGGYAQTVTMDGYTIPATGTYNVLIKDCADVGTGNYTLQAECIGTCVLPVPTITSLSPTSVLAGSGPFTLTVNGSGFASVLAKSVVQWNGSALTTTFVSTNQLSAAVPGSDIATAGVFPVTVVTPPGGTSGGTSNSLNFTVNNPVPVLTSISPSSATVGASPSTLTVNGSGFVSGSTAYWGTIALATTFVSGTELTAAVPAADYCAAAGTVQVTVVNASPAGGTSAPQTFTCNNPAPTLTSIRPSTVTAGGSGTTLTASGTGFVSASSVQWNATGLSTTYGSATQLTASIPAADIVCGSTDSITVSNSAPGGGRSASQTLTVNNPVPAITSISPQNAAAGGQSFTLTVNGAGFVNCPTAAIQWNGKALTTKFVSSTQLTATVSATNIATPGTAYVTVFNPSPGGGTTPAQSNPFTIGNYPVPTAASISPTSATAGGTAFTLTVNGTNFVQNSTVDWSGTALTTTFVSSIQLTAAVPATDIALGTAGTAKITVVNPQPGGGPSSPALLFTINNPVPVCSSISPISTPAQGPAFTLTVNGSKFAPGATVQWNGTGRSTSYGSVTQLTSAILASDIQSAGNATITVSNTGPGGGPCAPGATFTIENPLAATPVITPASGSYGAGQRTSISDVTPGATIYYTTNGTTPTTFSAVYAAPFLLESATDTVEAIATAPGYTQSDVASTAYIIGGSAMVLDDPAYGVTTTAAGLRTFVNGQNLAGQVWFTYGASPTALTNSTPPQALIVSTKAQTITAAVTGLAANTTYYFQAIVTTPGGTSMGAVLSFTTP